MRPIFALLLIILASIFTSSTTATAPGLITSINTGGITTVANQIIPYAIKLIQEFDIPDVDESHLHISNIRIPNLSVESFAITTDDNGVHVKITHINVNVKSHFKYKYGIIHFSGDVSGGAKATATLSARLFPKDDHFGIEVTQADVDIQDFNLHISGGLVAKILNLVKSLFNGLIKRTVKTKVAAAISSAIMNIAKQYVDAIPTAAGYGSVSLSLAPASFGVKSDNSNLSVAFDARVNGQDSERHNIDQSFAASGAAFDGLLDVSVFNSGFHSIPFKVLEYTEAHPGSLPVPGWKCHNWKDLIPLMNQDQFHDLDVKIQLGLESSPSMRSQGGILSLDVPGQYSVFCGDILMAKLKADLGGGMTVGLIKKEDGKQYILPQLQQVGVKFTVEWTLDGMVFPVAGALEAILNVAAQAAAAVVNTVMLNGVLVPSIMGLEFLDVHIDFPADAIRFQTNLAFNPPQIKLVF